MAGAQNELSVAERRKQRERERREQETRKAGGDSEIEIGQLVGNPRNAREELEGIDGLAATYKESGVLQTLNVIPVEVFAAAFPEHADAVRSARFVVIGGNLAALLYDTERRKQKTTLANPKTIRMKSRQYAR